MKEVVHMKEETEKIVLQTEEGTDRIHIRAVHPQVGDLQVLQDRQAEEQIEIYFFIYFIY